MSKKYNEGLNVATLIENGVNCGGGDCKEFIDGVLDGMLNSHRTLQHDEKGGLIMVYIIIAHMFPVGEMVLNDCAYRTHSQAEKALDEFREDNMEFDRHTDCYEIVQLSIMEE